MQDPMAGAPTLCEHRDAKAGAQPSSFATAHTPGQSDNHLAHDANSGLQELPDSKSDATISNSTASLDVDEASHSAIAASSGCRPD